MLLSPQPWIITAGLFVSLSSGQCTAQNQARRSSSLESPGSGSYPDSTTRWLCDTGQDRGFSGPFSPGKQVSNVQDPVGYGGTEPKQRQGGGIGGGEAGRARLAPARHVSILRPRLSARSAPALRLLLR